jgi:hypothetical protein
MVLYIYRKGLDMTNTKDFFDIKGDQLLKKVKELIAEGNVRKIILKDKTGKEMMSFPLTFGVVGAVLAPVLAAVGALAALVNDCTISVEMNEKPQDEHKSEPMAQEKPMD